MGIHAVWIIALRLELETQRQLKVSTYRVVGENILDPIRAV